MNKQKFCFDCAAWSGGCRRGKLNRIAGSQACELFTPKDAWEDFLQFRIGLENLEDHLARCR